MATLKISDLSVGDWVMVEWPDGERWRGRLTRLFVTDAVEVCCANNKHVRCSSGFISSIPITAEILVKNGFVKNGEYNEWNIGTWDDIPFIGISLSRQSMRIKNLGTDIFLENKVVYVHQLQHALRLAGVDKEINL